MSQLAPIYITALSIHCALGTNAEEVLATLQKGQSPLQRSELYTPGRPYMLGQIEKSLPQLPANTPVWFQSRNNRLLQSLLGQIDEHINKAIETFGRDRVAVIMGSSTSGISDADPAIAQYLQNGQLPDSYHYRQQEYFNPADYIRFLYGLTAPAMTISTACSSGAKAIASAARWLRSGTCDAVIAGGVDTLCQLTLAGFRSLESVSDDLCLPFSRHRSGINLGEGGAVFLLTREKSALRVAGSGESSDAHHISAPDPTGSGAKTAMQEALNSAGLLPNAVDYINLHGTATVQNDTMEARAINELLGSNVLCSSTKPFTGHTLGAAGAVECAICSLLLTEAPFMGYPLHLYDGQYDPALLPIALVDQNCNGPKPRVVMSNSFAFGGNNVSLVLVRDDV